MTAGEVVSGSGSAVPSTGGDAAKPDADRHGGGGGPESSKPRMIDSRLPRFNQAVLALVILASFVARFFWTVPLWAVFLLGGVLAGPKGNPIQAIFAYLIKPRLGPPKSMEDPRPPRFAASLGFLFLGGSTAAYLTGLEALAWGLALLVAALASVAAIFNICVGCEIYVLLMRTRGGFQEPWRVKHGQVGGGADDRPAQAVSG